jgi:pimeloyl-ACP methyl ester carboxylesterase
LPVSSAAQEHVTFPTQGGGLVYADLYGQSERGVMLAHGGQFSKESGAQQAHTLTDAGFRVLAFDFRGHGESRGPQGKSGGEIQEAVEYDVLTKSRSISSRILCEQR